jgi:energy-coupling factor transporter ATP-binding protein EcfA2
MAEIALDEVTKVYGDGTQAISDLTLDLADAEFMVFVGPSGCGKTTALRMVAGGCGSPRSKGRGIDKRVRVHDLRRTTVSLMINEGAQPKDIQKMRGHSSMAITMDQYSSLFPARGWSIVMAPERRPVATSYRRFVRKMEPDSNRRPPGCDPCACLA